jgi:hypothetical protein
LRGLADALEATLPDASGHDEEAHRGNGLAQRIARRSTEPDAKPSHSSVMRSNAFARAWGADPPSASCQWVCIPSRPWSQCVCLMVFPGDMGVPSHIVMGSQFAVHQPGQAALPQDHHSVICMHVCSRWQSAPCTLP